MARDLVSDRFSAFGLQNGLPLGIGFLDLERHGGLA
jgi:hypothetical protein